MRGTNLVALMVCGTLLGCSSEPGAEPVEVPSDAAVDTPAAGGVTGKVVLAGTVDLAGFPVTLIGPVAAAAVTDATGAFSVERLPAGRYAVSVSVPSTSEGARATVVEVGDGPAVVPDLAFTPLGELTGKVTLGSPTGNAGITVVVAGTASSGVTDDSGTYALRGVPAGARDVVASLPGWLSGTAGAVAIEYRKLATAPDLVLARPAVETGALEGTIAITGETTHAGVTVVAVGPTGASAAISDASGAWSIKGLSAGKYALSIAAPATLEGSRTLETSVEVGKAATVPVVSFTPLGTLRGKVTLGGRVTGNGAISVWVPDAPVAFTDDAGNWEIRSARTGVSTIRASKAGWTTGAAVGPKVTWRGDATAASIDLTLDSTATAKISGVATVVGRTSHEGVEVSLSGFTTTTAADGSYTLEVLDSGLRTLSFRTKDGLFEARLPNVLVTPGGAAFVVSGSSLLPIPRVRLVRGRWLGQGRPLGFTSAGEVVVLVSGATPRLDVISTTGGATRTLVSEALFPANLPLVSPDGAYVAFTTVTGSTSAKYVVPTAGGAPQKLLDVEPAWALEFLPDGKHLVYRTVDSSSVAAVTMRDLATGTTTRVATTSTSDGWTWRFSPDGSYLAAPAAAGGLVLAPIAGGASKLLPRACAGQEWSHDGRLVHSTVSASAYYGQTCDLSLATPGSTAAERLLLADAVHHWELSPDRKWLLAWRRSATSNSVWLVSLATTDAPILLADDNRSADRVDPPAVFASDSAQLAFAQPASAPVVVKLMKLTSTSITTTLGTFPGVPRLSFLGSTVVVRESYDPADVFLVPPGGAPSKVATKASRWLPSADGRRAAWAEAAGVRFATDSGTASTLGYPGIRGPVAWSPDSGRLTAQFCETECWTGVVDTVGAGASTAITWQQGVRWMSPSQALFTDWWPNSFGAYDMPSDEALFVAKFP